MEINLTAYLLFMGCSAAACILWFFLAARKQMPAAKAGVLSALTLVLGIVLGIAGARLVWFLCRINTKPVLFALNYYELSYYGGVAGVIIGLLAASAANIVSAGSRFFGVWNFPALGNAALWSLFAGIILAILSAIYPAVKAARMAPMEAMRVQ